MRIVTRNQKPPLGATIDWGHPLARGLVAHWALNDGCAARVADLTGHLHGTMQNMEPTDWIASDAGQALAFGGTDEYVNVAYSPRMTRISDAVTCVAWVRVGNLAGNHGILGRYTTSGNQRCIRLVIDINEQATGYVSNDGTAYGQWPVSGVSLSQNVWHQVAWVKLPGSDLALNYTDGVLVNSGAIGGGITSIYPSTSAPITLGMGYNTTGEPLTGDLGRVTLWDRALLASEIAHLYSQPDAFVQWGLSVPLMYAGLPAAPTGIVPPLMQESNLGVSLYDGVLRC